MSVIVGHHMPPTDSMWCKPGASDFGRANPERLGDVLFAILVIAITIGPPSYGLTIIQMSLSRQMMMIIIIIMTWSAKMVPLDGGEILMMMMSSCWRCVILDGPFPNIG